MENSDEPETISYKNIIYHEDYEFIEKELERYKEELPLNYELEFRLIKKDGSFFWVKETARRLDNFQSSNIYMLIFTDITNIKNEEYQIRSREDRYRIAVMNSKDIVVWFNIKDNMLYFPNKFSREYYIPKDQNEILCFLDDRGYIQPESISAYIDFYEGIKKGENRTVEIKVKGLDNILRWFFGTATIVYDENNIPISAVIYFSDITEKN